MNQPRQPLQSRPRRTPTPRLSVLGAVVTLVAVVGAVLTDADPANAADDVKSHVQSADAAVARAVQTIQGGRYAPANKALKRAARHTRQANSQAAALIGAPPTDPESDDPPGPPAVTAALRLDNRVSLQLVPLFDGLDRPGALRGLRTAIAAAQNRRSAVLDGVLALPAEGDGADYADGLTDTLPSYGREVAAYATALDTFDLTAEARTTLTTAHERAREAQARMKSAYGGGERSAP